MKCLWQINLLIWLFRCSIVITDYYDNLACCIHSDSTVLMDADGIVLAREHRLPPQLFLGALWWACVLNPNPVELEKRRLHRERVNADPRKKKQLRRGLKTLRLEGWPFLLSKGWMKANLLGQTGCRCVRCSPLRAGARTLHTGDLFKHTDLWDKMIRHQTSKADATGKPSVYLYSSMRLL